MDFVNTLRRDYDVNKYFSTESVSTHLKQVLSLKLYKAVQPSSTTDPKPADKEDNKPAAKPAQESSTAATASAAEPSATVEPDEGGHDPFEGLDDITKTCFEVCTKNPLRVMFPGARFLYVPVTYRAR